MNTNNLSSNTPDSVKSSLRQVNNETTGIIIEDNIRNVLQQYRNFEKIDGPRKIYMKKISYGKNSKEKHIFKNEETTLTIQNINLKFLYDDKSNIRIYDNKNDEKLTIESKFNNKEETFTFTIDNTKIQITVYPCQEIEIDGFFKIRNFSKNLFNEKEASILY